MRLRDFCDGELNYTKTTHRVSRFSIYIGLLDFIESRVMKRTSISYCAMRDNGRADILESKTSQCEVLLLRWQSQPNFCDSILLKKIFYHYNVYIIMIFLILILKRRYISVSKSFLF